MIVTFSPGRSRSLQGSSCSRRKEGVTTGVTQLVNAKPSHQHKTAPTMTTPTSKPMRPVSVKFDKELRAKARKHAKKRGLSFGALVRLAVERELLSA